MSPAQTANFMAVLGTTLARSGLSTRAECCASIGWNYAQQYAAAIEADKAARRRNGAVHQPRLLRSARLAAARLEQTGLGDRVGAVRLPAWDPAWDDGSLSSGFTWAQNIYEGLTAANLGAFLYLWGASMTS